MRRRLGFLVVLILMLASSGDGAAAPVTGFVEVPGGRLFYEESGSGPAVILIHGGFLDHRMWDPQAAVLARDFRVIRYDVAGHGQSPLPPSPWNSADHLGLLMKELKVERASLVGLSLGGRIAIDFAIASPEKVACLVLVDPGMSGFPFKGRDFGETMAEAWRAKEAGDREKVAELFMRSWLDGPHRTPSQVAPAVRARVREMILPNALRWDQGAEMKPPAFGRLRELRGPILVIEGELDCEDIHEIGRLIERSVAGTRRAVIPGVAHMPSLERPAEVNRLLLDFLPRRPAPAAGPAAPDGRAVVGRTIDPSIARR